VTQLIESQLWGITATDPATFIGVSMLLGSMAMIGAAVPAHRALRVDPAITRRTE
jgi:putative ABC transport system permease protein